MDFYIFEDAGEKENWWNIFRVRTYEKALEIHKKYPHLICRRVSIENVGLDTCVPSSEGEIVDFF